MIARSNTRVASRIRQPNTVQFMGTWRNKGNASCFSSSGPSNHLCVIALRVLSNDDDYVARISIMHDECLFGTVHCPAHCPLRYLVAFFWLIATNSSTTGALWPIQEPCLVSFRAWGLNSSLAACLICSVTLLLYLCTRSLRSQIGRCVVLLFVQKSVV